MVEAEQLNLLLRLKCESRFGVVTDLVSALHAAISERTASTARETLGWAVRWSTNPHSGKLNRTDRLTRANVIMCMAS